MKYFNQHLHQILLGAVEAFGEKMNRYPEKAYRFSAQNAEEIIAQYEADTIRPDGQFLWTSPRLHETQEGGIVGIVYIKPGSPVRHYLLDVNRKEVFDLDAFISYQLGHSELPTENLVAQ